MSSKTSLTPLQSSIAFLWVILALIAVSFLQLIINPGLVIWINNLIIFAIPLYWFSKRNGLNWQQVCRLKPISTREILLSVVIGFAAYPIMNFISAIVGVILDYTIGPYYDIKMMMARGFSSSLATFFLITGIVFLAPFFEELFFRGLLQSGLGGFSSKKGMLLTGFMFGAMHALNNIPNAFGAVFIGLLLSYIAYATGSIWPTIIIHWIVNTQGALRLVLPSYFSNFDYLLMNLSVIFLLLTPIIFIVSLLILIFAVWRISKNKEREPGSTTIGFKALSLLVVGFIIIGGLSTMELHRRLATPTLMFASKKMATQVGRGLNLTTVEVEKPSDLFISCNVRAESLDAQFILQDEQGKTLWSTPTRQDKVFYVAEVIADLQPGTYELLLQGDGDMIRIDLEWGLRGEQ